MTSSPPPPGPPYPQYPQYSADPRYVQYPQDPQDPQYLYDVQYPQRPHPAIDRHEGMAVTALVLGIIGTFLGVYPDGFFGALLLGLLAVIFGVLGYRPTKGKWGLALGVASVLLGVIGAVIVHNNPDRFHRHVHGLDRAPGANVSVGHSQASGGLLYRFDDDAGVSS